MDTEARLRIAFVCDTLHAVAGGGVVSGEFVVDRLRREHDVVTLSADGDRPLPTLDLPIRALHEMGFRFARPDRARIREALSDVDVVHLQLPFWLSFSALREAKRRGLPVVAGFHVQPENALHNVGIRWPRMNEAIYRFLVDRFYADVDAVICPTAFAEEKLRSRGLTTRTVIVTNGVTPDVARAMDHAPPHVARRSNDPFFILAIGRLAAEKRQELILDAVRRSHNRDRIRVVIAGAGPREAELRTLAKELPNGATIGFLPRAELLDDLAHADLFVHASEVELEGMVVLEAMSAGLPALIADAPESAAKAFALNDDFLFPAGDAAALSRKIDALIDDPVKLEAAREPYRERAHHFDFEASVHKLVDVYRWAIVRHAGGAEAHG